MRHRIGIAIVALALSVWQVAGLHSGEKPVFSVRDHPDFESKHLANKRAIRVYLPPGYATDKDKRYPVFYLHDGQMRLNAEATAERLIRADKIWPVILVFVANTKDRFDEYTFHPWPQLKKGGKGTLYGKFLTEELKPYIDKEYRTRPDRENTAVGGASLGGLVSLDLCRTRGETFSMCAAMSPSLQWGDPAVGPSGIGAGQDGELFNDLDKDAAWLKKTRIWFDMGGKEFNVARARRLDKFLQKQDREPDIDYKYFEVKDAGHDVKAWASRFDQVLLFHFAK